ncbi:MAG: EF-P lysine aminoacylase EpmA [Oleiphilaceae bacterium]|nr:EF-P lysine aminoacylase EpmA [Oleiphilaceae bacterium]
MRWRPSANLQILKARAALYAQIRAFFAQRNVLEVETPILNRSTASEPLLASIGAQVRMHEQGGHEKLYLHTSPEYPMKRLLAAGAGAIFQICKTFRDGETGRRHNPEFTMLEWYRPGFALHDLMGEVSDLLVGVLQCQPPQVSTYRQVFEQHVGIDPFTASLRLLNEQARKLAAYEGPELERDAALDLLMACVIEPRLGLNAPLFVTEYPPTQASLARVIQDAQGQAVAARFELYIQGVELANAYWELCDATEQRARFEQDNLQRRAMGLPEIPLDEHLLAAMEAGLPECSGVALGIDRLLMIQQGANSLEEVLAFPIERV